MTTITVQVRLTDDARWTVKVDGVEQYTTYPTRNAAIAAGVRMAMENDALLMIHGVGSKDSELDCRSCTMASSESR
ncbi:DUF2188 domain-containing protein [Cupriavidus taiwanensis]|uniref:DUF2188 domain-containing protein n=1 Tax=Cupriavidus taiwanensis TaxID=164546 RepID=A0A375J4C6_9BURK|nr:DUF2188 domain-containing protein [Cupriavidus taiwanensis]SPR99512.1 conserved hypothetical protein [Cupriavidus taiwanensis]